MPETTVVTIAHRLLTISQYDKIVVLEKGEKTEEGSPLELLQSGGRFSMLVDEGGAVFRQKMLRLATDKSIDPSSI